MGVIGLFASMDEDAIKYNKVRCPTPIISNFSNLARPPIADLDVGNEHQQSDHVH